MIWAASEWFWMAPLALMAVGGGWLGISYGRERLYRFVSKDLALRLLDGDPDRLRKRRLVTLGLASLLVIAALARPQFGVKSVEVTRTGIDIVIAVDTSKSMAARDVEPDRLARAKNEIGKLVRKLAGNRIGLVAFAGKSFVECPLTTDAGALFMFIDALDAGAIPVPGTNIAAAIGDAIEMFSTSKSKSRALVLVTDGEELAGEAVAEAQRARDAGIVIFPIGIGSEAGAPIPQRDRNGKVKGYKKDRQGKTVISRLDTKTLEKIAKATGGTVTVSQGEKLDLALLIDELSRMEKSDIGSREFTEYEERYQLIALAALIILLLDALFLEANQYGKKERRIAI